MKRAKKSDVVAVLKSQFFMYQEGVPGVDQNSLEGAVSKGYFLYEDEIEDVVKKNKKEIGNAEDFVEFLMSGNAIIKGTAPSIVSRQTRINSKERATEVANNPEDSEQVAKIQELTTKLIEIRDQLNKLIDKKSTLSIALKNKKVVAEETKT